MKNRNMQNGSKRFRLIVFQSSRTVLNGSGDELFSELFKLFRTVLELFVFMPLCSQNGLERFWGPLFLI
jgi:hypothetical protein